MTRSFFENLEMKPADPIFGLTAEYQADSKKNKINLIIGVCVEEDGSDPRVWDVVKEAEKKLIEKEITKDYLGIDGDKTFTEATSRLVLGTRLYEQSIDRVYAAQTPGGTVALRIILEFLQKNLSGDFAVSDPTWANHVTMANYLGLNLLHYPYYDKKHKVIRFTECVQFLETLKPKTVVLLQAESHNPTGMNFSMDEWKVLADLCKRKELIPLFDVAYQGFGVDIESDVAPVQLFVREGIECFIAYSYSKNFAIYSERIGALLVVTKNPAMKALVASHIKAAIRVNYSNPSRHGSSIVGMILNDPTLRAKWEKELREMAARIQKKRVQLADLFAKKSGGDEYHFLQEAKGFFSLFNLNKEEVLKLKTEHGIYVTGAGRINMAGVNQGNIERIVDGVLSVAR